MKGLRWGVFEGVSDLFTFIIIIVGFIECKIDTNPLMRLSPRRESPGTGMGRHLKTMKNKPKLFANDFASSNDERTVAFDWLSILFSAIAIYHHRNFH